MSRAIAASGARKTDATASLVEDRRHDLLRLCARIGFSPPIV
jgi:hypothetical protein